MFDPFYTVEYTLTGDNGFRADIQVRLASRDFEYLNHKDDEDYCPVEQVFAIAERYAKVEGVEIQIWEFFDNPSMRDRLGRAFPPGYTPDYNVPGYWA